MKAKIEISSSYGFDHNWTLVITSSNGTKSFYLGQDVKFCNRVLGISPSYIVKQIGSNDVENPTVNKRLANFIINKLELTENKLKTLQSWELCAQ
jgi:hypothetical protein